VTQFLKKNQNSLRNSIRKWKTLSFTLDMPHRHIKKISNLTKVFQYFDYTFNSLAKTMPKISFPLHIVDVFAIKYSIKRSTLENSYTCLFFDCLLINIFFTRLLNTKWGWEMERKQHHTIQYERLYSFFHEEEIETLKLKVTIRKCLISSISV
jgi:hypothetical protein